MKRLSVIANSALLLFHLLTGLNADTLSDGLVAYYPFDGDGNDFSGNGRNLTIHGCDFTPGIKGQALNFINGNSRADNITDLTPAWTNNFSVSLWLRPNTLTRNFPEWFYLISSGAQSPVDASWLRLGVNINSNTTFLNSKQLNFGYGGGVSAGWFLSSDKANSLQTNVWNHIVATA